jgi:hypothetical protein
MGEMILQHPKAKLPRGGGLITIGTEGDEALSLIDYKFAPL